MELADIKPLSFCKKRFVTPQKQDVSPQRHRLVFNDFIRRPFAAGDTLKKNSVTENFWREQNYIVPISIFLIILHSALLLPPQPLSAQETPDNEITIDEINTVARELWCPLCSGVRLDVCELTACDQMREQIGIQLANDASAEEIKAYFIEQYGPQVLGEPPFSGFNWLAWAVPVIALAAGALLLLRRGRAMLTPIGDTNHAAFNGERTSASNTDNDLGDEVSRVDILLDSDQADVQANAQTDRYAEALDKELNAYE